MTTLNTQLENRIDRAEREIRVYVEMNVPGLPVNGLSEKERRQLARRTGIPVGIVDLMNPSIRKEAPIQEILQAGEVLRGRPA